MAINGKTVLAVIPARSGSKRCPGKNFKCYRGKSLVGWAVDAAKASRYIDTVKLSLDSDRPPELCTDDATSEDVVRYHVAQAPHDLVVLLQPTSPLRTAADIDGCLEMVREGGSAFSCRGDFSKNGAVYAMSAAALLAGHSFGNGMRYIMPYERSLDIDYPEQFAFTESDIIREAQERQRRNL